jgi:hypothetical protein
MKGDLTPWFVKPCFMVEIKPNLHRHTIPKASAKPKQKDLRNILWMRENGALVKVAAEMDVLVSFCVIVMEVATNEDNVLLLTLCQVQSFCTIAI